MVRIRPPISSILVAAATVSPFFIFALIADSISTAIPILAVPVLIIANNATSEILVGCEYIEYRRFWINIWRVPIASASTLVIRRGYIYGFGSAAVIHSGDKERVINLLIFKEQDVLNGLGLRQS